MATMWDEIRQLQAEMGALSASLLGSGSVLPSTGPREFPSADISETENEIVARIDLPGVEGDDIEVNATNAGVDVKVACSDEQEMEDATSGVYRIERRYGGLYKHIPVPDYAIPEKTAANYKNGVLDLRIPKKKECIKKRVRVDVR